MSPDLILDPDPDNILGKGILDAEREAALRADGYVFAMWVTPASSRTGANLPPFLVRSKRPIAEAITDALLDAYHTQFVPPLPGEPAARRPIVA